MKTERLYHSDAMLRRFHANVLDARKTSDGALVVLDQTAFYPTSGGQPNDRGTLGGVPVRDVTEDGERIVHHLERALREDSVVGEIDWPRRFDHMQQHTAQHLLSHILREGHGARTIGFQIGEATSYIDLDRMDLAAGVWEAVEEQLSERIRDALPVSARVVTAENAARLGVEKRAEDLDAIRLVSIGGIDLNACGGTHVRSTSEIEIVKLVGTENVGSRLRLTYLAGGRARHDYRKKHEILKRMALSITTGIDEVVPTWERDRESVRLMRKELDARTRELLGMKLRAWLDAAPAAPGEPRIITRVLEDTEAAAAPMIANQMRSESRAVVLLGWRSGGKASILFARSPDVDCDLRPVLAAAADRIGGRGGGRPERVQAGGTRGDGLQAALEEAETRVREALGRSDEGS